MDNKQLVGNWICVDSVSSDSTDYNRFYKGYLLTFDENNKYFELLDSSKLNSKPFSISEGLILIDGKPVYNK